MTITQDQAVALAEQADRRADEICQCRGEFHPDWHAVRDAEFARLIRQQVIEELARESEVMPRDVQEVEPVAYVDHADGSVVWKGNRLPGGSLLYAHPPTDTDNLSAAREEGRREMLEEVDKKFRCDIDHAIMNDIRLPLAFGKRFGDPALRVNAVEAVLDSLFRSMK